MSNDYFNPPNSVWPNGLKRDDEGYVNFYTSGTNKVDISTITWPEGTKVKSPFVYQDDKLVGFIDTKALDIDNNDTTININYTHFDADLDSIMENTLTINTPANAVVNVKYGAVDKVLTEKIEKLIGKEKCEVKFDKNNNKATIAFALDTTETQLADVESLLNRVLPSNLTTEMEWSDGLPTSYTRLEYLESTGTQYIRLRTVNSKTYATHKTTAQFLPGPDKQGFGFTGRIGYFIRDYNGEKLGISSSHILAEANSREKNVIFWILSKSNNEKKPYRITLKVKNEQTQADEAPLDGIFHLFRWTGYMPTETNMRIFDYSFTNEYGQLQHNLIPSLDSTGTPCMFDLVSHQPLYNFGTGDFLYPTDAAPAMSAGLDETFYAKLTEHGVRRLYHVPAGCTMTKDEYAAANGFKELVEPPMPLEGYWTPQWRETEIQLICDWVETEPPTEEV